MAEDQEKAPIMNIYFFAVANGPEALFSSFDLQVIFAESEAIAIETIRNNYLSGTTLTLRLCGSLTTESFMKTLDLHTRKQKTSSNGLIYLTPSKNDPQ
jgi:hypothetical protein